MRVCIMSWRWFLALCALAPSTHAQDFAGPPPDLGCDKGPSAAAWRSVKLRMRALIEDAGGFNAIPKENIRRVLESSIADVKAVDGFSQHTAGECGYGRLCIQLLSLATEEDPMALAQPLQELPQLSSPVLTTLLDVPWLVTALSGWPFFGILAQLGMHKANMFQGAVKHADIDGLEGDVDTKFFDAMMSAMQKLDFVAMSQASYDYLQLPAKTGILGDLTAMAAQASVQSELKQRTVAVETLQKAFQAAFTSASQLDLALTSRWPLWSLLHVVVDAFSVA